MRTRYRAAMLAAVLAAMPLTFTAALAAQAPAPPDAAALDAIVESVAAKFAVPGFAVAVVKDGQVVLQRGYGHLRAGSPERVDEHTLFYIASATKAFTAAGLGILADENKVKIDQPLAAQLTGFALADPELTRAITLRDALSHRTGVPRADLFLVSALPARDVLPRLAALAPAAPIRSRFTYSNQMYLAAGLLIEQTSGQSWRDFIESRLLRPIGFVDGNAGGVGGFPAGARAASPHIRPGGPGTPGVPFTNVARAPYGAGGINASAADMSRWLQFNLGDGTANGTRLVGANVLAAMQAPNVLVTPNLTMPDAVIGAYGLGWFVHDYRGRKIVQHGGNGEGWTALVWMSPSDKLGIAVLSNVHNTPMAWPLAMTIADRYLGQPARDWTSMYAAAEPRMVPPALPAPSTPLAAAGPADAGTYAHPMYGQARLTAEGDKLQFTYGELTGTLEGTQVSWSRAEWGAVLGASRLSVRDHDGRRTLTLEAAGERFEFTRDR